MPRERREFRILDLPTFGIPTTSTFVSPLGRLARAKALLQVIIGGEVRRNIKLTNDRLVELLDTVAIFRGDEAD
jgi:hypothetical protein